MHDPNPSSQSATVAIHEPAPSAGSPGSSSSSSPRLTSTSTPDEGRFLPGTLVAGRYRIISLLGAGGMGEVYRATDLTLAQPVALKFLSGAGSERMLERFHNEVRVARQVSHPNVCRVYDVGEADGMPYISMEYVDGEDLASLLTRIGRLPSDKALEIARKICAGVAAAHDKGVIHRDLKPANIMLDKRGNVVIMDFGLAAVAEQLSGAEARSGTPAYMAPEQLRGESATAKSDLYALGLVLYEVFTGKRVYEATTLADLLRMQESAQISSMSTIAADVDPAVEKAIRRCLEAEPERRPPTALAIAAALPGGDPLAAALAAGETPSPELVAASGKTEGLPLNKSVPLAVGLAALILAVPFLRANVELHALVPYDLSAETLAQKAREFAASFGYTALPADRKYDLHWMWGEVWEVQKQCKNRSDLRRFFAAEPPLQLGYRESPLPLLSRPDGEVTERRPAPTISGMIEIWVNSKGELRQFLAVPLEVQPPAEPRDIDAQQIARATGFDIAQWQETAPPLTPLYAFDRIKAWKGTPAGLDFPVTVEASAWRGRLTELHMLWPWSTPGRMPEQHFPTLQQTFQSLLTNGIQSIVVLFSALLAWRNLRAGRGDKKGANRLAIVVFVLVAVEWVCTAHWVPDIGMLDVLEYRVVDWLSSSALIWLLYIGLEPVVRARWPHALVTWSRALSGRWRDPLVASHLMYGALIGVVIGYFFLGMQMYSVLHGVVGGATHESDGTSARFWIASVAGRAGNAVEFGLIVIFVLFWFRRLLRKDWIASLAVALLFTLQEGDVWHNAKLNFAFYAAVFTVLVFVLLRLGLVSLIASIFFVNVLLRTPAPQTFSKPYEWAAILYPVLLTAIIAWAFWRTSRDRILATDPA